MCGEEYQSRESIREDFDLRKAQRELAEKSGVELKEDVAEILLRFHHCARRRPPLTAVYTEDAHSSTGSLFDI